VPLTVITVGELCALLFSETFPDILATEVGANCTAKLVDCPGFKVTGKVKPLKLKPAPLTLPCEMLKLAVPELVRITLCEALVPTATVPKLTLPGAAES
jgi:hypothetical protein